jgi:hemoglobin/transferrin/lactoferrin receptor protein
MGLVGSETVPSDSGAATFDVRRARPTILLASVAALALGVGTASAQDADNQDTANQAAAQDTGDSATAQSAPLIPAGMATALDRITVVSRTGESAIEQMASVSNVDQEQLERRMATTTEDIFFGVPGVAVQTSSQRIRSSINIRGLQDAGRVTVLIDGARQNFEIMGHQSQSLLFVEPELLQQVDVIRGPVANTYGSGAIGGVVAFETKDASDFLRDGETWAGSNTLRYETNGSGWTNSTTGAFRFSEAADIIANIVWRDYGEYKDGDGNRVSGTGFDMLSGLAKATLRPTENSELKLGWMGSKDSWSSAGDTEDFDVKQNSFTARYNVTDDEEKWLDLHINTSFNKVDLDEEVTATGEETNYGLETYGVDIWNTSRFDTGQFSHEVTYGGDFLLDDVVNQTESGGSDLFNPSGKRQIWGAYIQDKVTYEWLEVIGGLRYDSYSLEGDEVDNSDDHLSPRISVGVSPFTNEALSGLQFYGTYAEGFRSPTVAETLISGLHPFPPFTFLPNPDLQPETAETWEFGVNYELDGLYAADDSLRLKAAYFHNDVDDYISFVPTDTGCDNPFWGCFQNQNFAKAKIEGFELESFYEAYWGFLGLSASVIDGYTVDNGGVEDDLSTIPSAQVTGQLGLRFLENRLLVGTEVQYNAAPKGNEIAEDFTLVNVFAQYNVNDNFKLDFRVDNLFDVAYVNPLSDPAGGVLYEPGITAKLGATMRFGG